LRVACQETQDNLLQLLRDGQQLAKYSTICNPREEESDVRCKSLVQEIPKKGWLYKQGGHTHCRHRFFVLDRPAEAEYGILNWFVDDEDFLIGEPPESWVSCYGLRIDEDAGEDDRGRRWFTITAKKRDTHRRLELGCYSDAERVSWVQAIASFVVPSESPDVSPPCSAASLSMSTPMPPPSPVQSYKRDTHAGTDTCLPMINSIDKIAGTVTFSRPEDEPWRFSRFVIPDPEPMGRTVCNSGPVQQCVGQSHAERPKVQRKWQQRRLRAQAPGECAAHLLTALQQTNVIQAASPARPRSDSKAQAHRFGGSRGLLLALSRRTSPCSSSPSTLGVSLNEPVRRESEMVPRALPELMLARALSPVAPVATSLFPQSTEKERTRGSIYEAASARNGGIRAHDAQVPRRTRSSIMSFSDTDDDSEDSS